MRMHVIASVVAATTALLTAIPTLAAPEPSCVVTAPGRNQQQFDRLMAALTHKNYTLWTEDADTAFLNGLSARRFSHMASTLDRKLQLQKGWHANYVTHLQDGAYSSYVWRVTLYNGRQLLMQMTKSNGKVVGFHLA